MTKHAILAAGIVLTLVAAPGLAQTMSGPGLVNNTGYPTSGKYVNEATERVVIYDARTGLTQDGGPAAFNPLPQSTNTCSSSAPECENTDPGSCVWTADKWNSANETDIAYGRCASVIVRPAGQATTIAYRAAIREAKSPASVLGGTEEWTAKGFITWFDGPNECNLDTLGCEVEVEAFDSTNCIRNITQATYSTTGFFLVDCVWRASNLTNVAAENWAGLPADGFKVVVKLFQNGNETNQVPIFCEGCLA